MWAEAKCDRQTDRQTDKQGLLYIDNVGFKKINMIS